MADRLCSRPRPVASERGTNVLMLVASCQAPSVQALAEHDEPPPNHRVELRRREEVYMNLRTGRFHMRSSYATEWRSQRE